jgi:hypothetical protein
VRLTDEALQPAQHHTRRGSNRREHPLLRIRRPCLACPLVLGLQGRSEREAERAAACLPADGVKRYASEPRRSNARDAGYLIEVRPYQNAFASECLLFTDTRRSLQFGSPDGN